MSKAALVPQEGSVCQFRIEVMGVEPKVWRRVLVPISASLDDLHNVIQGIFDWDESHLHIFETKKARYMSPDFEEFMEEEEGAGDTTEVRLHELYQRGDPGLRYNYDFADDWHHSIKLEKVLEPVPGQKYPEVVEGAGAGPLEDSGGAWGYNDLVRIWKNRPSNPDEEDLMEWAGPRFNPERFDLKECNGRLAKYLKPRVLVRATPTKKAAKGSKRPPTGKA
jgi:hypothetical protein